MATMLLGAPLMSATAGASTVGLLGSAGVFAPSAGTLFGGSLLSKIGLASKIFGAVQGYQGAKASAAAQEQTAKYNAAVASNNAALARQNADLAGQMGEQSVAGQQAETRAKVGAIKAAQAASNIRVDSGSAVDVRSSAAQTGQLSALSLRAEAARKAHGYQQQAQDYTAQSEMSDYEAKNTKKAGGMEATSTLLGGLSDAGTDYMKYLEARNPVSLY